MPVHKLMQMFPGYIFQLEWECDGEIPGIIGSIAIVTYAANGQKYGVRALIPTLPQWEGQVQTQNDVIRYTLENACLSLSQDLARDNPVG